MRDRFLLAFILSIPLLLTAQEAYRYNSYYYQRASLFDELPIDSTDIVMLGNSLTDGCEWHELLQNTDIKNRGISSDVVAGVTDRIEQIAQGHPRKIFLLIGINDVSHDLTADSIAQAILHTVDLMHKLSPATELYVQSLLPVNPAVRYKRLAGKEDVVCSINRKLQAAATSHHYTYIDLYSHFILPGSNLLDTQYSNDGLHLMGNGYKLWGELLRPYIYR